MKYGDKFILKTKSSIFKYDDYICCVFICERKDKGVIVYEQNLGFTHSYSDCSINNDNILTQEQFINEIAEKNSKLNEKIIFCKNVSEDIKKCPCFERNVSIINELNKQLKQWEKMYQHHLDTGTKDENEEKHFKKILHDLKKGIKRRKKRIWYILDKYKNVDLSFLYNLNTQIRNYKSEIERNEMVMKKVLKFLDKAC